LSAALSTLAEARGSIARLSRGSRSAFGGLAGHCWPACPDARARCARAPEKCPRRTVAAVSAWPPPPVFGRREVRRALPCRSCSSPWWAGVASVAVGRALQRLTRDRLTAWDGVAPRGRPAPPARSAFVLPAESPRGALRESSAQPSHRPDRAPLLRFCSLTAFAGRAALSGAAGNRTIPLRRCEPSRHGPREDRPGV
jgi:hypothetical protein